MQSRHCLLSGCSLGSGPDFGCCWPSEHRSRLLMCSHYRVDQAPGSGSVGLAELGLEIAIKGMADTTGWNKSGQGKMQFGR